MVPIIITYWNQINGISKTIQSHIMQHPFYVTIFIKYWLFYFYIPGFSHYNFSHMAICILHIMAFICTKIPSYAVCYHGTIHQAIIHQLIFCINNIKMLDIMRQITFNWNRNKFCYLCPLHIFVQIRMQNFFIN